MSTEEENTDQSDVDFRATLSDGGFKPNAGGLKWAAAQPAILVAGAYKVIRTAAERASKQMGRGRE